MRRRFQKGSLQKIRGAWVARWWQDGERKARMLGRISQMAKAQAQSELAAIVSPINTKRSEPSEQKSFGDFVQQVYLPFYRRKWKRSTVMTSEDRLAHHLTSGFEARSPGSFDRDELQALLDGKGKTLSFSVVDHLRWDLKQIFDMAVAEGYLQRSPAALLFTLRECRWAMTRVMTVEEVRRLFSVLEVRERLIAKLRIACWDETRWVEVVAAGSGLCRHPAACLSGRRGLPKVGSVGAIRGALEWARGVHR